MVNTFKYTFKQVCVDAIEVAGGGGIQRLSGIENPEYLNTTFVIIWLEGSALQLVTGTQIKK